MKSPLLAVQILDPLEDVDDLQIAQIREAVGAWIGLTRDELAELPAEQTIAGVHVRLVPRAPTFRERIEANRFLSLLELAALLVLTVCVWKLAALIFDFIVGLIL